MEWEETQMDNFTFQPTWFQFSAEKDAESLTGVIFKEVRRVQKRFLHYGGGSVVRSGLLDRVKISWTQDLIC